MPLTVSNYVDLVQIDQNVSEHKTEGCCMQEALVHLFYKYWKTTKHLVTSYNGDRLKIKHKQDSYSIQLHDQSELPSTDFNSH